MTTGNTKTARSPGGTVYHVIVPYLIPTPGVPLDDEGRPMVWREHPTLWTAVCGGKMGAKRIEGPDGFQEHPFGLWQDIRDGVNETEDVKPCSRCRAKYPRLGHAYRLRRFSERRQREDEEREQEVGPDPMKALLAEDGPIRQVIRHTVGDAAARKDDALYELAMAAEKACLDAISGEMTATGRLDALLTIKDVQRRQIARHQAQVLDMIEAACVVRAWVNERAPLEHAPLRVRTAFEALLNPPWPEPLANLEKARERLARLVEQTTNMPAEELDGRRGCS